MDEFIKEYTGQVVMLIMTGMVMVTLLVSLPQLLRANLRKQEMSHEERLRSVERGMPLPIDDNRGRMAGRIALLVPMASVISAATVTSFLSVYKTENLFAVTLAIWIVVGAVSLAAITGGVALIGRLAQVPVDEKVEEEDEAESTFMK